jgi:hypothetical protein
MKSDDTSSRTSDTQTYHETCGTDIAHTGPVFNDDSTQLDVAIIHQMVVDALGALSASSTGSAARRKLQAHHFVP